MAAASLAPHRVAFGSTVKRELHDTLTKLVGDHVMADEHALRHRCRKTDKTSKGRSARPRDWL